MRNLGLLLAPILVLLFPGAALADWTAADAGAKLPLYGNQMQASFDRFGAGLIRGGQDLNGGYPYYKSTSSLDDGVTWGDPVTDPDLIEHDDVGTDDNGNRIWVYATDSNTIRAVRSSPWEPGPQYNKSLDFSAPGVNGLKVSVNPAGDALLAWTSSAGDAQVAYWKSGTDGIGASRILDGDCNSTSDATPFLDPAGSATVAWSCSKSGDKVLQSSVTDASDVSGFSPPTQLADGTVVGGAQGSDGRGVILFKKTSVIPENAQGETSTVLLSYASRRAGLSFQATEIVAGSDERRLESRGASAAIGPDGEVLIGYWTYPTQPSPENWCSARLSDYWVEIATGKIDPLTGDLSLSSRKVSDDVTLPWAAPFVAFGADGRAAVGWNDYPNICGYIKFSGQAHVLYADPGEEFETVPTGVFQLSEMTFNAHGQIFAIGSWFGPFSYRYIYDTGSTLTPPDRPSPEVVQSKSATPPPAVVPAQKILSVVRGTGGRLLVKVETNVAGRFSLVARSGRTVVARSSAASTVGIATLTIKPNARAARKLKKHGRLKATLTSTFTPTSGAAPAPLTKSVIFKRK